MRKLESFFIGLIRELKLFIYRIQEVRSYFQRLDSNFSAKWYYLCYIVSICYYLRFTTSGMVFSIQRVGMTEAKTLKSSSADLEILL